MDDTFNIGEFTPYLLNLAAEVTSAEFQKHYKGKYGMLRTEWRVLFHLGRYGPMRAKDICARARLHKTKVSRAVSALDHKGFLARDTDAGDRRQEQLSLTSGGERVFADLHAAAKEFDQTLIGLFTEEEQRIFRSALRRIIDFKG